MLNTDTKRKAAIMAWATAIQVQGNAHADAIDPRRTKRNRLANKIDCLVRLAKEIQFEVEQ